MSNRIAISSYKNGLPLPRAFYFGQLRAETEIRTTGRSRFSTALEETSRRV